MKVSKLTNSLLVLLLSAPVVVAESKYPATDFQPKVVYQDSDYKHSGSSSASSASSSKSNRKGKVSKADSNYPAANFQPEVLYEDKGYKHTKGKVSSSYSSSSSNSSGYSSTEAENQSTSVENDESSFSLLLGLMIVAVAGFIFYKRGSNIAKPAKRRAPVRRSAAASGDAGGVSGVAKYLETKAGPLVSGVAKYLQERESVALSGVAKYVANQKVSERKTETKSVSGVDKYLKDRG